KIARIGRGRTLPEEDAQSDGLRAGLLQVLHIALADEGGEFGTIADDDFRGGRAALHRLLHHIDGDLLEVSRGMRRGKSFEGGGHFFSANRFWQLEITFFAEAAFSQPAISVFFPSSSL